MALEIEKFERGKCFICRENCLSDSFIHYECGMALDLCRRKRIKHLIEKYGQDTLFQNKLINWNE